MYKVIIQESKRKFDTTPDEIEYWETVHEMTTNDKEVLAGSLRAIANKYDPPKPATRGL